ncbi:MAG TPA: hypothetical protein VF137_10760 [Candidatus Dormibacteraeota bacterium]
MWRALLGAVAAVCVLFIGGVLVYFVITAVNGPFGVPLTSPTPDAGQAATQFGSVGFYLHVTKVDRGGDHVTVAITLENTSEQQQRFDPQDFRLQAQGDALSEAAIPADGCRWGRVDLYPRGMPASTPLRDPEGERAGATWFAAVCFPRAGTGALTLIWSPDVAFGPLSEPIRIPLR